MEGAEGAQGKRGVGVNSPMEWGGQVCRNEGCGCGRRGLQRYCFFVGRELRVMKFCVLLVGPWGVGMEARSD